MPYWTLVNLQLLYHPEKRLGASGREMRRIPYGILKRVSEAYSDSAYGDEVGSIEADGHAVEDAMRVELRGRRRTNCLER